MISKKTYTYQSIINELSSYSIDPIIKLGLFRVEDALKKLNFSFEFPTIHIAGTNGKGSTSAFLANILKHSGLKVGVYTSPHILKFNERIAVLGKNISDENIVKHYTKIFKTIEKNELTPFEIITIMAFLEFKDKKIDIAVVETGLGGRLDATNVIKPLISIITNINLEHKSYLGKTIESIAKEKAGIIKAKIPVVSAVKQKNVLKLFKEITNRQKAPLYVLCKEFFIRKNKNRYNYKGIYNELKNIELSLKGEWQKENVSLVLAAIEILKKKYGYNINDKAILEGVKTTKIQGRFELISFEPKIVVDVAHNLASIKRLFLFLQKKYGGDNILIIGLSKDKSYKSILKFAAKNFKFIILTEGREPRLLKAETLYKETIKYTKNAFCLPNILDAKKKAIEFYSKEKLICVTGSFFIIEEFLKIKDL